MSSLPLRNVALRLMFSGTNFHGWQRQPNAPTIQETLELAIESITGLPAHLTGCGRTDAGVHALKYCANFKTNASIPAERLPAALNSRLPQNISVSDACDVPQSFHAIRSCIRKEYTYRIYSAKYRNPFLFDTAYFYPRFLDITKMRTAANLFTGTHDFSAVRSLGTDVKSTVRTVFYFSVLINKPFIELKICADGFLYNMARTICGTVIYAGIGKLEPDSISYILNSRNRQLAGPTLPSHGLMLTDLRYDGLVGEMMNDEQKN